MRIRKRQVPLPLSSLSSVPVSDPHCFGRSPAVQLQLHNQPTTQSDAPPSDQPNQPTGGGNNGPDFPDDAAGGAQEKKNNNCMKLLLKEDDERGGGEEDRSHDFRKGSSSSGAYMATADLAQSYSSSEDVGSWCKGEKAFPLKKRRGRFDRPSNNEQETTMEKNKKMKTKMKTKMNKKPCVKPTENGEEEDQNNQLEEKKRKEGAKKRGTRGAGELMEGSRCSRVNGRGWRCCQKTLVGYSLCEHHLGKGRLRSMNSVRNRSLAAAAAATPQPKNAVTAAPLSIPSSEKEEQAEDEKKPLLMAARKKRVKLGMVKARSISSLLGENNIAATSTLADGDQNDLINNQGTIPN
ncbi:hypothetical protein HS088_TW05G00455 [Tripterygium wilfordii]|uniref:WRC domain-containing protein n=1 Tax=Tripterygium wilfordii TaxID=458696 RepID=A0A7J7DN16_TRIWF|nr:uncharacterized protein LOC119998991 [Tripterygium wilfordii]KAF5747728.1 hypothetical protein HS088_TW05G00455 [Tripterygium wilfordii]